MPALLVVTVIGVSLTPQEVKEKIRVEREQKEQVAAAEARVKADAIQAKAKAEADAKAAEERKIAETKEAEERKLAEAEAEKERKEAEVKDAFKKKIVDRIDARLLPHIYDFTIDSLEDKFYQISFFVKDSMGNDNAAEFSTIIARLILEDLVKQGRKPYEEQVKIYVTAARKVVGASGKVSDPVIGVAVYSWEHDQIGWVGR